MKLPFILLSTLLCASAVTSERFVLDDYSGIVTDTSTYLEWLMAPDVETDWLEAFVWLQELGGDWSCPSVDELQELFDAGITFDDPAPFILGGNWVWCGDLSNFDSVYCFDFISGYMINRVAEWNAYQYVSGFRALAVRSTAEQ